MKKKRPDARVLVFQQRKQRDVMPSGVEYVPVSEALPYFQNIEPAVHIGWRHPSRLTKAKSYVWCHDLQCPGAEGGKSFDKIIALSEFHKEYLKETQQIPEEKILLGSNGINPDDFPREKKEKDPLKIIFSSSPDRGLVQAIDIVKKAREISGLDLKLHCFYGFENMRKSGQGAWADNIEAHVKAHDFVTHHGQVSKKELLSHFADSAVWLYVNDFIETYCITALEAMYSGCWSIFRDTGALKYTMKPAIERGMCDMIQGTVPQDPASMGIWANALVEAVIDKKYKGVNIPIEQTWEKVADHFLQEFSA
jgi:glycosyltransferase involved in cell wall biosynthesis